MEIVTAPHLAVRNEWLALHREAPLQPELPIIDAHHHLWDRQTGRYLTHEFSDDIQTSGHRVVSSVYVQCRSMLRRDGSETLKPLGEIEFASGIAAMFASGHYANALGCEAIIGGLSLLAGDAMQPAIERAIALSGGRLRGMRNPLAWHPDPRVTSSPVTPPAGLAQSAPFRRGAACLARHALSLDVWVYHTQLEEIADLAREIPTLQIVIDHCGGPVGVGPCSERDPDMFQQWRNGMRRLAELPNVCVKISGFGMTVRGFHFAAAETPPDSQMLAQAWMPWFETIVSLFGAERCMFASNFPVDKGMFSYGVFWNACKRLAQQASPDEQAQLFWRTAATCYRLTSVENSNDQ